MNRARSGRRLRALVIHDTAFPPDSRSVLGTSEVELCSIGIGGVPQMKIGTWEDLLQIIQGVSDAAPDRLDVTIDDPDLILIDCHFSDDRHAPSIVEKNGPRKLEHKIERHIDPRGLLYGAVLASFYMGRQPGRALGFAVYSQDMEAAADNGYAQTFFSLLEALAGRIDSLVHPDDFKSKMATAPKAPFPDLVMGEALSMYRTNLLRAFRDRYYPNIDSFEAAYRYVARLVESAGKEDVPPDLTVEWKTGTGQCDKIFLRSLIADCIDGSTEEWNPGKIESLGILSFIDEVTKESNPRIKFLKPVQKILEDQSAGKPISWPEDGIVGYKQKTLALIIEWAIDRTRANHREKKGEVQRKATIEDLNSWLNLSSKQMNRALGRTLGNIDANRDRSSEPSYTGSGLIATLDNGGSWMYNQVPWLLNMVQEHLRSLAKTDNGFAEINWPRCLKPRD